MHDHPLDRPVWNALMNRQKHLALGDAGTALRFPADIEPFGATPANTEAQLQALGQLTPSDNAVALVELGKLAAPPGFVTLMEFVCHQMSASRLTESHDDFDIQPLTEADAPEMRALAELTQPGPFHARTHQLGGFVGVRENGRLIAMAGERLKLPGFTEISAVCTHPDARGQGLAAALMRRVAKGIQARGEEMFLHVYPHNKGAISVYEKLGFRHRVDLLLHVFRHRQPGETQ